MVFYFSCVSHQLQQNLIAQQMPLDKKKDTYYWCQFCQPSAKLCPLTVPARTERCRHEILEVGKTSGEETGEVEVSVWRGRVTWWNSHGSYDKVRTRPNPPNCQAKGPAYPHAKHKDSWALPKLHNPQNTGHRTWNRVRMKNWRRSCSGIHFAVRSPHELPCLLSAVQRWSKTLGSSAYWPWKPSGLAISSGS